METGKVLCVRADEPSGVRAVWLVDLVRLAIGWHFLYEGVWKLMQNGHWSCVSYLGAAQGPLAPLFGWMAETGWIVSLGNSAVQLGLVAIGLALVSGVCARLASLFGVALLGMFYLCQPPEPFAATLSGADGRFFLVERNAIEILGLLLIATHPCWRGWLRTLLPGAAVLAVFFGCVVHAYRAGSFKTVEAVTSATVKVHEFTALAAVKAPFAERAKIGGVDIARLALGGDLMAGHAHARDLIWTDEFMRRYNANVTLPRTVRYGLHCGFDTIFAEPAFLAPVRAAADAVGGTMTFFANCATAEDAALAKAGGAAGVYVRPETADALTRAKDAKGLKALFNALKATGLTVGIGAEDVATVKFAVEQGLAPDWWVLAFHALNYPAAKMADTCNNIWCRDPEAAAAYMKTLKQPWVAIRGLAGGGIDPLPAYRFAVEHGAAAVVLNLLDYRIVEVANGLAKAAKPADANAKGKEKTK